MIVCLLPNRHKIILDIAHQLYPTLFLRCLQVALILGGVLTKDENLCTINMTNVQIAFDMMNMQIVEPSSTFTF